MRLTLGSHAPAGFRVQNPVMVPADDVADMLMLAASVAVVVTILIAI